MTEVVDELIGVHDLFAGLVLQLDGHVRKIRVFHRDRELVVKSSTIRILE